MKVGITSRTCTIRDLVCGIDHVEVIGEDSTEIRGLCDHSKKVEAGDLFFAKTGKQHMQEAAMLGAVAFVCSCFHPEYSSYPQIITDDIEHVETLFALFFYKHPAEKLYMVGITGTNGKTTCSYIIQHLLSAFGIESGVMGTIGLRIKDHLQPLGCTTPSFLALQKHLASIRAAGCSACVMEVSSHGLQQGRVRNIPFDVAVFTNLTQDHLDYHHTMEAYAQSKAMLFAGLSAYKQHHRTLAVVNADSPYSRVMVQECSSSILWYGCSVKAQLRADQVSLSAEGSSCILWYQGLAIPFFTPLVGMFNLYNALAAIGVGIQLGKSVEECVAVLASFRQVEGRMERVEGVKKGKVFVDYAHTEDALENVLQTLRRFAKGRVFCVFGCGGDRDRGKRPKMGAVAERLADRVMVTSDNPRTEHPEDIIEEILSGMSHTQQVYVEKDRKIAIHQALSWMEEDDILLIAGKGQETYQIFHDRTIHFDDRIVAKEYLG